MEYYELMKSPIGDLAILEKDGKLAAVSFEGSLTGSPERKMTPLITETIKQITEYFEHKRNDFDLPLCTQGTLFMQKVYDALQEIPYGETRTYKQIAERIGSPKSCRAVGMANHRNNIPIIIPCHRVIGTGGAMIGYGGGLGIKAYLLEHEQGESQ